MTVRVPVDALSERVTVTNARGLHARASAKFVTVSSRLPDGLDVVVECHGHSAGGQSIMGLMMLGAARGDTVTIHVAGPEVPEATREAALRRLVGLVTDGFGED